MVIKWESLAEICTGGDTSTRSAKADGYHGSQQAGRVQGLDH